MGKITIDDTTLDKLTAATATGGLTELCDSQGNVVGYFNLKASARIEPQISEEELDRRQQETELYTFDEVMAHLSSL